VRFARASHPSFVIIRVSFLLNRRNLDAIPDAGPGSVAMRALDAGADPLGTYSNS
jgi:hypothetical protein